MLRRWSQPRLPLLLLLLLGSAAGSGELAAKCGAVAGCIDSTDPGSLNLLQQHALHLAGERPPRAAAKATAATEQPGHPKAPDASKATAAGEQTAHSGGPGTSEAVAAIRQQTPLSRAGNASEAVAAVQQQARLSRAINTSEATVTEAPAQAPSALGLQLNAEGDLAAFLSSLVTNIATIVFCVAVFMVLRVRYPLMYSGNVVKETAPSRPDPEALFSWLSASLDADTEAWIKTVGLDHAMLLEFSTLAMKICAAVGIPMCFIMAPLHCFYGGKAAGGDNLSAFSIGNVEYKSWLYWVHAFVVWAVVMTVTYFIFNAQRKFVHWRFQWMKHIPAKCANTVLVSGLSKKRRSDKELREFFEKMFPGAGRIKSAYVVKDTSALLPFVASWKERMEGLELAKNKQEDQEQPVMVRTRSESIMGKDHEAEAYYEGKLEELWKDIYRQRAQILEASKVPGAAGLNSEHGFVTFAARVDAEMALRLDAISKDENKWTIERPPEPKDIRWAELMEESTVEFGQYFVGYALLTGLFVAYVPLIIGLTHLATAVDLGPLQSFWAGLAPTFGLQFMICFLPTFIVLILRSLFTLKAQAFLQQKLQTWYFWFQVFFIILATAIGQNVTQFFEALIESPLAIFGFMGKTMPSATHFYLNFMVLQWTAHSMNVMRYVPLAKYKSFCAVYSEEEAAAKAEPEDQDYYGIGSRSARWNICLTIAIVFGSLSPLMYVLTFLNFAITRVLYGYLIPFAETRKPDTGGHLWVTSLRQLFAGMVIFVILMTGVLYDRASSHVASWICASSLIFIAWGYLHFTAHFSWEKLPLKYVAREDHDPQGDDHIPGEYVQAELYGDYEAIKAYADEQGWEAPEEEST